MFDIDIISQDKFLDMPQSTQLLYFHLGMNADDEGFVGNPKSIMRGIGINSDDMNVLIAKNFIIPFETGIILITHWHQNNYLNNSRIKETIHTEEKAMIEKDQNQAYFLKSHKKEVKPKLLSRFGENSIEENSIEENSIIKKNIKKKVFRKTTKYLREFPDKEAKSIAKDYEVPEDYVKFKVSSLVDYLDSHGKWQRYKDYKSLLQNVIRKDKLENPHQIQKFLPTKSY